MVEKRDGETGESFNGREETTRCRVCDAPRFSARVESGSGAYETAWLRCEACGSWSIARVPEPEKLERFYVEYAVHHRAAAVNPGANDGRRYTSAFEGTRRAEYRFGLTDVRLTFRRGDVVVDYGAQDGVFLDEVRSLEPGVTSTV